MDNNDLVKEFEQKFGKKQVYWNTSERMFYLEEAALRNKTYPNTNDTYNRMSWNDFLIMCQQKGFIIAYRENYAIQSVNSQNVEEEVVLINQENGLVLYANSFASQTYVNVAKVYGEIKVKEGINPRVGFKVLNQYSTKGTNYDTIQMCFDGREDMFKKIENLSTNFDFLPTWNSMPFIWFLNTAEERAIANDLSLSDAINQQKIEKFSEEAKQIMGVSQSKTI